MRYTLKTIFSLLFIVAILSFITLVITSKKELITTGNTKTIIDTKTLPTLENNSNLSTFHATDLANKRTAILCSDRLYVTHLTQTKS